MLLIGVCVWAVVTAGAAAPPTGNDGTTSKVGINQELQDMVAKLGHADYREREAATEAIMRMGPVVVEALERLSAEADDPEIRFRLRLIIESFALPDRAVIVVRVEPGCPLRPGDVITQINGRQVLGPEQFALRLQHASDSAVIRIRRDGFSQSIHGLDPRMIETVCQYRAARGEAVAEIVGLYFEGLVEAAYERLRDLPAELSASELSPLLIAIIAHTAGDGSRARDLLGEHPRAIAYERDQWSGPSRLDLAGPFKAPYQLEMDLWTYGGGAPVNTQSDPDLRMQRVLVPAGRYAEALVQAMRHWWGRYRNNLEQLVETTTAGNMIAVSAWMLSELDLVSECLRLIEPRSVVLRQAAGGVQKWLRVRTDAWLPFLAGEPQRAVDASFEHAVAVLGPTTVPERLRLVQVPEIAARIAFFLYQIPNDRRVGAMLELVNRADSEGLSAYAWWMLFGLHADNAARIATDLDAILENLSPRDRNRYGRASALLRFADGEDDPAAYEPALEHLESSPIHDAGAIAFVELLQAVAARQWERAAMLVGSVDEFPGRETLSHTLRYVGVVPDSLPAEVTRGALLSVPIGAGGASWLVLTRSGGLRRVDLEAGSVLPVSPPSETWYPNPLTWPWISCDAASGRAWVYDRQRLWEVGGSSPTPLRVNITPAQIPAVEVFLRPHFEAVALAVGLTELPAGENGPFFREDIRFGSEFVADPDLPELGWVRPLAQDSGLVQVTFRGGPHILIDIESGGIWSSHWFAEVLDMSEPPLFWAQAVPEQSAPLVYLISDQGLIRFDVATEAVRRVPLPGSPAFPPLCPEWCPYERRDPRWVYCARLPASGGAVYRVRIADDAAERVDMINMAYPPGFHALFARSTLRAEIEQKLSRVRMPTLAGWTENVIESVEEWIQSLEQRP